LRRAGIVVDTLHPLFAGRVINWFDDRAEVVDTQFERAAGGDDSRWESSPFAHLLRTGGSRLRCRPGEPLAAQFPIMADLAELGATDYVAYVARLGTEVAIGEMDGIYLSWASRRADGFRDAELALIDRVVPALALAVATASHRRIAATLAETYLGRDAGRRVLDGAIVRGRTERLTAVLWWSDLKGFTRIVDSVDTDLVVPLLDDYAEAIVSAVHGHGGQVLKFMGDAVLAFFDRGGDERACVAALDAAVDATAAVAVLNHRRAVADVPVTGFYLALHIGEVLYGNIGAADRLDFTAIGPAVNEVSRIASMSRSVEQDVLVSEAFARACGGARSRLVSLGRYALRGVKRPQELFTLDSEDAG